MMTSQGKSRSSLPSASSLSLFCTTSWLLCLLATLHISSIAVTTTTTTRTTASSTSTSIGMVDAFVIVRPAHRNSSRNNSSKRGRRGSTSTTRTRTTTDPTTNTLRRQAYNVEDDFENFDYTPFLEGPTSATAATTDGNELRVQDGGDDNKGVVAVSSNQDGSSSSSNENENVNTDTTGKTPFTRMAELIHQRYACTRYARYDGNYTTNSASVGHPASLTKARQAVQVACRAPTGFNLQPYKMVMVTSPAAKQRVAKYCIGRNKNRVLDADCTVLFLADRQALRLWPSYKAMIEDNNTAMTKKKKTKTPGGDSNSNSSSSSSTDTHVRSKSKWEWWYLKFLLGLFSSGYPYLPKWVSGPLSWCVRVGMRVVSWGTRAWYVVPTLSTPECWSQKNTALVAMTYMLACTAHNLVTTPMEGYLTWGIRQELQLSRRYTIPLIVSTGLPYQQTPDDTKDTDDTGISHGNTVESTTPRFSYDSIIEEM